MIASSGVEYRGCNRTKSAAENAAASSLQAEGNQPKKENFLHPSKSLHILWYKSNERFLCAQFFYARNLSLCACVALLTILHSLHALYSLHFT